MKTSQKTLCTVVLAASVLMIIAYGCTTTKDDGKIPITTASQEARQLYLQARDLQERLQVQESLQYLEQAIAKDPNFAMAYLLRAPAQPTARGFFADLEMATGLVEYASEGERLWILGFEAGVNGFPMQQREYYQQLIALYPNDERAHNLLGIHYLGQQEWENVVTTNKRAVEINPNFSTPHNQLGYGYRFLENYEASERAFKKYIELIPDDPNPYDSYAELLMKMGRFDESIAMYEKALEQNPNFVASFTGIALNLNLKGEYGAARKKLEELFGVARTDGERRAALFATAVSYTFEGKMKEAMGEIEKQYAIAMKNNDAASMAGDLNATGNILLEMGEADDAQTRFDQSIATIQASNLADEVKANNQRFYLFNSARTALKKGNFAAADTKAAEFQAVVEAARHPVQIRLAHQLNGQIALAKKDYDTAVTELQQAPFGFNPYNHYRLALAYRGKGDVENAKDQCTRAANFNGLDGLNYAYIKTRAEKMLAEM
jgi:tetratricopeptide (TPR) repeat protein